MIVFLTGASGFIGKHVLRALLQDGHTVRALVREPAKACLEPHPNLLIIPGEMNAIGINELKGCDALIHLAAHGVVNGMNDWQACFRVNVTESLALWLRAADAGLKRFIICGSCFEYGRSGERYEFIPVDAPLEPTEAYHASKAAATMAALALAVGKQVELAILRPFHVFGKGEAPHRFWPALRKAARDGVDFPMSSGQQVRDFVSVEQVADDFVTAVSHAQLEAGRPVIRNLGSGRPQTLLSFAEMWWIRFGATGKLRPGVLPKRENEVMRYVPLL